MYEDLLWSFANLPANYIAIDTETTGLFKGDEAPDMISLGMCVVMDSKVNSKLEFRFKPHKAYADDSQSVHGIEWTEAQSYPNLSSNWDNISRLLSNKLVVAHNAAFDWRVLTHAAKKNNLIMPKVQGVFCSQRSAQPWALSNSIQCSERGPSLETMTEEFGIKIERSTGKRPHAAKQDAYILTQLIERLRNHK
jgi:DNA polymerase-3 subunit epsilon